MKIQNLYFLGVYYPVIETKVSILAGLGNTFQVSMPDSAFPSTPWMLSLRNFARILKILIMEKRLIIAFCLFITTPFTLLSQELASGKILVINATLKEKMRAGLVKTNPMQPAVVLFYTQGKPLLSVSKKESLKMLPGEGTASTPLSPPHQKRPAPPIINLSAKEKMKLLRN